MAKSNRKIKLATLLVVGEGPNEKGFLEHTEHKWRKKDLEIVLVTRDKTLFSIAEIICQRCFVTIEQYDIEQVSEYFSGFNITECSS